MRHDGAGDGPRPARPSARVAVLPAALMALAVLAGCSQAPAVVAAPRAAPSPTVTHGTTRAHWQPDRARMPADDLGAPPAPCARQRRAAGWLRAESRQPGQALDVPAAVGAGDRSTVVGYADRRSAACGDSVAVSLSGPVSVVQLVAYRVGAYRDGTVRPVWRSADVAVAPQPLPPLDPRTHLREPAWPVAVRVPVTAEWPPGLYLFVPQVGAAAAGPPIPLVVRDDAGVEPVLFVASTMTWNAYGDWGGYSLYRGPDGSSANRFLTRARVASFDRPLTGGGYDQFRYMDLPVVEQLERSGLDVAYTTDVDVDRRPSQLLQHAETVLGGHSEYWTRREYDALAAARTAGVNLAFLGANNLWWHARLDTRPFSPEPDREIVQRVMAGDTSPLPERTVLWSQWPEGRDPAVLLGHSHAAIAVHGGYQLLEAPPWLLVGTGLQAGTASHPGSVLPGSVGNEADGYKPQAANPADLTVVAAGVLRGANGPVTVSASYYVAPSGAGVFSAGSTDWACALQGECSDQKVPEATSAALRQLTLNVVLAFQLPRAGRTHPSVPSVTPPPAALLPVLDVGAIGTYGGGEAAEEGNAARATPRR